MNWPGRRDENVQVEWAQGWDERVDDALRSVPELPDCPHSLLRLLLQNDVPRPKLIAMVSASADGLVALIPLREVGNALEVATNWIVPGPPFPARRGWHLPALRALRRDVGVVWWPFVEGSLSPTDVEDLRVVPTRRMDLRTDFDAYWRKTGLLRNIRNSRKRCAGLSVEVDAPGAAEWIIRNAELRWRFDPTAELRGLQDRLIAAAHLEGLGRHHTLTLHDGDEPVSGATVLVHDRGLVGQHTFRRSEYDRLGVGVRIFDASFHWAAANEYEYYDIGGADYGDYKKRWAPEDGLKASFRVRPAGGLARRVVRRTRRLAQRAMP